MKTLFITRHAKTHPALEGGSDSDRSLTERGQSDARLMASELSKRNWVPDIVISSPARRAIETSRLMCDGLRIRDFEVAGFLYGYYSLSQLTTHLHSTCQHAGSVMIIAHNPLLAKMADDFTGYFYQHLSTTGVVLVDFDIDGWNEATRHGGALRDYLYPKLFKST